MYRSCRSKAPKLLLATLLWAGLSPSRSVAQEADAAGEAGAEAEVEAGVEAENS